MVVIDTGVEWDFCALQRDSDTVNVNHCRSEIDFTT